jgi:hypothetical protein
MQASVHHTHAPLTGSRVGRYLVGERLGVGGAASVYLALLQGPLDFERLVALKIVHEHLMESSDFVTMFLDEANVAVRLTHPNIVHSYELGREGPHLFLAMEYLAGQPLWSVLERARARGERLPPALVAWIGARAAEGLAYAHGFADESGQRFGLVHRDVSPQNVFLTYDGRVLVIDWGIARAEGRLTHTGLGRIKGKSAYMAPEQMLKQEVDYRADLFALGATLFEAAVGNPPFENEDARIALLLDEGPPTTSLQSSSLPRDLSETLERALRRNPGARHDDATEMARELDRCVLAAGMNEPGAAVGAFVSRLFAEERERQARGAKTLRGEPRRHVARMPSEATTTANPMASTVRPFPSSRRPRWAFAAVAAASVAAVGVALTLARPRAEVPARAVAAIESTVTLEVQVEPAVEATILVAGRAGVSRGSHLLVPRGAAPVDIEVTAPGFERTHVRAVPDRDQLISVRLQPTRTETATAESPVVPPAPKPALARPAAPMGGIKGTSGRVSGGTAKAVEPAPALAPGNTKPRKDPLVTDYPF